MKAIQLLLLVASASFFVACGEEEKEDTAAAEETEENLAEDASEGKALSNYLFINNYLLVSTS